MNSGWKIIGISLDVLFALSGTVLALFGFMFFYFILNVSFIFSVMFGVIVMAYCIWGIHYFKKLRLGFQGVAFKSILLFILLLLYSGLFVLGIKTALTNKRSFSDVFKSVGITANSINNMFARGAGSSSYPGKFEILSNYMRLLMRRQVVQSSRGKMFKENIFGQPFVFYDYQAFESLFEEIFIHKIYHFTADKKDPFIIDAGSNIGVSVLYFKKLYPNSHIIAFEADPTTFPLLEKNIAGNKLSNVQAVNCAVSNNREPVSFFSSGPGGVCNKIVEEGGARATHTIPAAVLSDYIDKDVDLLKIDIEGAENLALEDLVETGKIKFIKEMIMEYHHDIKGGHKLLSKTLAILEENNFAFQISSDLRPPFSKFEGEQFFLVHAYRKNG